MTAKSFVYQRYSCRHYSERPVDRYLLEDIIFAGMQAPSARNEKPWEFIVVTSKMGKENIALIGPQAACCKEASAVIIAVANLSRIPNESPWWIQDMSACVENMLLRATELQLGSVWLGVYPRPARVEQLQCLFHLESYQIPIAAIPVGYPETPHERSICIEEERIHWEENK